jgi:hypothetical protein
MADQISDPPNDGRRKDNHEQENHRFGKTSQPPAELLDKRFIPPFPFIRIVSYFADQVVFSKFLTGS